MKFAISLLFALLSAPLQAAPVAFDKGDPKVGEALHTKSCMTCHDTSVYSRANRIVKTPAQLAARIAGCNANTGAGWFPQDEANVGAYLNHNFYHFK